MLVDLIVFNFLLEICCLLVGDPEKIGTGQTGLNTGGEK